MANLGLALYAIQSPLWTHTLTRQLFRGVKELRVSYLHNTFGTNSKALLPLMRDPRLQLLEVHFLNEVGQRNNRLGKYELLYGYTVESYRKAIRQGDAKLLEKLKRAMGELSENLTRNLLLTTELLFSIGLESNLSVADYQELLEQLRFYLPAGAKLVWNPVNNNPKKTPLPKGHLFEQHGSGARTDIVNLDGEDIKFHASPTYLENHIEQDDLGTKYLKPNRGAHATFLWTASFNLIKPSGAGSNPAFIDPRARKFLPPSPVVGAVNKILLESEYVAPVIPPPGPHVWDGVTKRNPKDKGFVWKQSDVHPGAVAVLPQTCPSFKSVAVFNGSKKIADLAFSGLANGDRQHWRSSRPAAKFPFNVTIKAATQDGQVWGWLIANPKTRYEI